MLAALKAPSGGAVRPKSRASRSAVASLDPSSAMTMRSGGALWPNSAASVTGSTSASLCAATITATLAGAPGGRARGRLPRRSAHVWMKVKTSSTVS